MTEQNNDIKANYFKAKIDNSNGIANVGFAEEVMELIISS